MDKTTKVIIYIMLTCFVLGLVITAYSYYYISLDKGHQCLSILIVSFATTGVCCFLSYILLQKKSVPRVSFTIKVDPGVPDKVVADFIHFLEIKVKEKGGKLIKEKRES